MTQSHYRKSGRGQPQWANTFIGKVGRFSARTDKELRKTHSEEKHEGERGKGREISSSLEEKNGVCMSYKCKKKIAEMVASTSLSFVVGNAFDIFLARVGKM
jgi:hypothetical protein